MGDKTLRTGSEHPAKKGLSGSVGDWVAPILAGMMFIGMLMAMVSVLLGRAD
jgi:hypothetical protein